MDLKYYSHCFNVKVKDIIMTHLTLSQVCETLCMLAEHCSEDIEVAVIVEKDKIKVN